MVSMYSSSGMSYLKLILIDAPLTEEPSGILLSHPHVRPNVLDATRKKGGSGKLLSKICNCDNKNHFTLPYLQQQRIGHIGLFDLLFETFVI